MEKVIFRRTEVFEFEFNENEFPELFIKGTLDLDKVQEALQKGNLGGETLYDVATYYKKFDHNVNKVDIQHGGDKE